MTSAEFLAESIMVIDSSALVAVFMNEPEREAFLKRILSGEKRLLSAASLVEAGIVLEARSGPAMARELDLFLHAADIQIAAVDFEQAEQARIAFRKYGKGRHQAALNFGDCFTYALAKVSAEPILAKGQEFVVAGMTEA